MRQLRTYVASLCLSAAVVDGVDLGFDAGSASHHEIVADYQLSEQQSCAIRLTNGQQLSEQLLQPISKGLLQATSLAHVRPLPFEALPITRAALRQEFYETTAFLNKTLSKDPRLKPEDVEVRTDHMQECTACKNYVGAWTALHKNEVIDVGTRKQILVDDWVVDRWLNIVRFLNPPASNEPVLRPDVEGDQRFGCPCSAIPTHDGGVRLYHTSKGKQSFIQTKNTIDEHAVVVRNSSNGRTNWSSAIEVKLRGKPHLKTFVAAQPPPGAHRMGSTPPVAMKEPIIYAGYEGGGSMACLAHSRDGINFETLQPTWDFPRTKGQCSENKPSFLGMAADAYVTPTAGEERDVVWYRQNFGTSYGWREIRGLQVAEIKLCKTKGVWAHVNDAKGIKALPTVRLGMINSSLLVKKEKLLGWYLDRLGKLERYRRQLYSVQLTKHSEGLYLGLATVLEWPKDISTEPQGAHLPAYKRDTTNVYLVTSRDGVHIDDGWIYAHRPLLPKGAWQRDWNAGMFLPAAQILSDEQSHLVYYEARSGMVHHENRFAGTAVIGMAAWQRDRIVGLRQSHARSPGVMITKVFMLRGKSLWLDFDTGSGGDGGVGVEVLDAHGTVIDGFAKGEVVSRAALAQGEMAEVRWLDARGTPSRTLEDATLVGLQGQSGRALRLRFSLAGGVKLYAFQIRGELSAQQGTSGSSPGASKRIKREQGARRPPSWMCCSKEPVCAAA